MLRFGGHENQSDQPLLTAIGDAVILPRRRQHDLAGAELALLIADGKQPLAFKHIINFVLPGMGMGTLLLARLETIGVAKEAVRFEKAVLLHFFRRELP